MNVSVFLAVKVKVKVPDTLLHFQSHLLSTLSYGLSTLVRPKDIYFIEAWSLLLNVNSFLMMRLLYWK